MTFGQTPEGNWRSRADPGKCFPGAERTRVSRGIMPGRETWGREQGWDGPRGSRQEPDHSEPARSPKNAKLYFGRTTKPLEMAVSTLPDPSSGTSATVEETLPHARGTALPDGADETRDEGLSAGQSRAPASTFSVSPAGSGTRPGPDGQGACSFDLTSVSGFSLHHRVPAVTLAQGQTNPGIGTTPRERPLLKITHEERRLWRNCPSRHPHTPP